MADEDLTPTEKYAVYGCLTCIFVFWLGLASIPIVFIWWLFVK
jgi:hypothetical protein